MKKSERQEVRAVQIGTSSLILIFTVLCLVIFSVMSITGARNDYNLALKNKAHVEAYYKMDGQGEELKAEVNEKLVAIAKASQSADEYEFGLKDSFGEAYDGSSRGLSYVIPGENEQSLVIRLVVNQYNDVSDNQENFTIQSWFIQNDEEYEIDDSIPVWEGK